MEAATTDLGDFSHPVTPEEDDILRYLLSDSQSTEDNSSPDSSPPRMFEDTTTDDSPAHWSQEMLTPPVVPQLSELSLDLNPEMLYGSNFGSDFSSFPVSVAPSTPPKDILVQPQVQHQIPLVPIVQPPVLPIVQPPHVQVPIVVEPPKKARASSKKRLRTEAVTVPSPQEQVALPRDTLLQISSQSMERYVETLQNTRSLSNDDQKELKRQKRLIKNRESAQLSRERKRAYIDQLEARIAQLVAENGQLKSDNTNLRQSLSRFQDGIKAEPVSTEIVSKVDTVTQSHIASKMGGLLTIGGNRSTSAAKAGVCLLIVLFSFGLFMNANKTNTPVGFSGTPTLSSLNVPKFESTRDVRAIVPVEMSLKRGLLEAFPEVKDEENDTDSLYEPPAKFPKALPESPRDGKQVIRIRSNPPKNMQQNLHINTAGIFKVSYSPEPASFIHDKNEEHSHDSNNKEANSTYMLFLDPRPDLDESDSDLENSSASVSATHDAAQLQVATPRVVKNEPSFPPVIISLSIPDSIANGSNPLLLPEGLSSSDSLLEITCQVVDISITTSERPRKN